MDAARIVLLITDFNRNSLAALAGGLEATPSTADLPIVTVEGVDRLVQQLHELCVGGRVVVVAFSFGTLGLIDAALAVRRVEECVREHGIDNAILVAGGAHPSAEPEETLKLGFDFVVVGEGEASFADLVSAVARGSDRLSIQGVAALRDGAVVRTGRSARVDLDAFPGIGKASRIFSYIEITRGCARACTFCHNSFFFGGALRHRSLEGIENSVRFLHDIGWRDIHFLSPDALSYGSRDPDRPDLEAIAEMLRCVSGIAGREHVFFGSFPSELWPASVSDRALEIITRYAANDKIIVGAQSGSQEVLDRLHRHHTIDDVIRAVDLIVKWELTPSVDFLFGLPGETEAQEQASVDLMTRLADKGAQIHSHTFIPLPGTPLADEDPPHLSNGLKKALDRLAGPGKQYGSWHTQLERTHRIAAFRRRLRGLDDARSLDLDEFSD